MDETIKSLTELLTSLTDLLPGFILLYTRSRFTSGGRLPSLKENVALYIVLSAIYLIVFKPFFVWQSDSKGAAAYVWTLLVFLIYPALLGTCLGVIAQKRLIESIFSWLTQLIRLNVSLVDPTPTAWDWRFSRLAECFVIIKLKDGSTIYGRAGLRSFVSSDPNERDIYIEPIYTLAENGDWQQSGARGIWIGAGEISTIEFIPEAT